jgi:hypothetical protein
MSGRVAVLCELNFSIEPHILIWRRSPDATHIVNETLDEHNSLIASVSMRVGPLGRVVTGSTRA